MTRWLPFMEALRAVIPPDVPQELSLQLIKNGQRDFLRVPLVDLATWPGHAELAARSADGFTVYTSVGVREPGLPSRGKGAGGGIRQTVATLGVAVDIDLANPEGVNAHRTKERLPVDAMEAAAFLEGVPDPSYVVSTGYGLQAWWLFDSAFVLPDQTYRLYAQKRLYKSFEAKIAARAEALGFHFDRTCGISAWNRLPGSFNWKDPENPREVVITYDSGLRYSPEKLLGNTTPVLSALSADGDPEGEAISTDTGERLGKVIADLRRSIAPQHEAFAKVDALLKGESFADSERDKAMNSLLWVVINWTRHTTKLTPEEYAILFKPSLSKWTAEDDAEKSLDDELAKITDKAERAIEIWETEQAEKRAAKEELLAGLRMTFKVDGESLPPEIPTPTIGLVYANGGVFVHHEGTQAVPLRGWKGPFKGKDEIVTRCKDAWDNSPTFDLDYVNAKGETKAKGFPQLLREYGETAIKAVICFDRAESSYDFATRELYVARSPLRDLEPKFCESFHEWGRIAQRNPLLWDDFCSAFPDLSKPLAIGYQYGPKRAGKSVIGRAFSQLWSTAGPMSYKAHVMSGYFDPDHLCFVIDEGLPLGKSNSTDMREFISSRTHNCNPKGFRGFNAEGYPRVLVAANNLGVIAQLAQEELTTDDVNAIAERVIYFETLPAGAAWMDKYNVNNQITNEWVDGNAVAKHLLWLAANHKIASPGKRFAVEGSMVDVHRDLVTRGHKEGIILEWIARFMTNPDEFYKQAAHAGLKNRIFVGDGRLLVNTAAIVGGWSFYGMKPNEEKFTARAVGHVLAKWRRGGEVRVRTDDERPIFHEINPDYVFDYATGPAQIGDRSAMMRTLNRPITDELYVKHFKEEIA